MKWHENMKGLFPAKNAEDSVEKELEYCKELIDAIKKNECRCYPYREGCYEEGAKKKTYSETLICDAQCEQARFQETEHFKEKMKERYKYRSKKQRTKAQTLYYAKFTLSL